MNAALIHRAALLFLLVAAVACTPGKLPATVEHGSTQAEAADSVLADIGAPADDSDSLPENMRLMARLEADVIGSGPRAIILVVANEDHYELRVLARSRTPRGEEVTTGIIDSLTLDSSPYGPPMVSVAKRVLVVDHATGGGNSTRTTYRYRFDDRADRMRLIGLDVERHARTVSHDSLSWNLLTGARVLRTGRPGTSGASDKTAFRYGPQRKTKLAVSPVYMSQTPDPDEVLDEALGAPASDQCGEDSISCQETLHKLQETLALYEGAVAKAIGDAAQPCWRDEIAAFRRALEGCGDADCRHARLHERLASLSDLQPTRHRTVRFTSQVPLLIAVLGPENENEPDGEPAPFEARGNLVHASTDREHMGVAVRDGLREHVIVFDMDLGSQPGHDKVMGLVGSSPTIRVLVRGYRRMALDGIANFETGRCRLVYQLVR